MSLSIVIPIYNSEKYLEECLSSIKSAEYDFEVILVNDGSTDRSREICEEYCKNDKRFKLYNIENHGVSYSRNFGVKKSNREYVMFVDSDDILKSNWSDIFSFRLDEDIVFFSDSLEKNISKEDLLKRIIGINLPCIAGPVSKLYKKNFICKNNLSFNVDIINGEDMLYNVEALLNCDNYKICNESFYCYRQNVSSSTKTFNKKFFNSDLIFQKNLKSLLYQSNFESNLVDDMLDYAKVNAIITIIYKLSRTNDFAFFKKNMVYVNRKEYVLCNKKKALSHNLKYRMLFFLLEKHLYYILFSFLRIKSKFKYRKSKDDFIVL